MVRQSFVTDEDIDWNQLALILAQYYKQRAQITIQIYEISNQLQRTESRVLKEIGEIQTIIKADEEAKKRADAQKELYYRTFVQRKVNSLIRTVVQDVYSFIFKQSVQYMANEDPTIVAFDELKEFKDVPNKNADVYFMKKPILGITIDPNGSLEPRNPDNARRFYQWCFIASCAKSNSTCSAAQRCSFAGSLLYNSYAGTEAGK